MKIFSIPSHSPCLWRSALAGLALLSGKAQAQTYFDLSIGNFAESFATVENWTSPSTGSWTGLAIDTAGTIPSATRITAPTTSFQAAASSAGVQRPSGAGNIQFLTTGTPDNSTSTALDLNMNFSNRDAGTLAFNAATVFNSTGNRGGTLRVYYTINGSTWTELIGGGLPYAATNNVAGSQAVSVNLPAAIDNQSTVTFRFYYHNGTGGAAGSRPKISVDDVSVTSTVLSALTPTITSFGPPTGWGGTQVTITGTNFTGTTGVAFNGLAGVFVVNSATEILATAPSGVTTGKLTVTTPEGSVDSATNFTAVNPNTLTVAVVLSSVLESASNPATTGTITRAGPLTSSPLTVTLTSSDTTEITVPSTVEFTANQLVASFDITAQDDSIPDGTQTVTITATNGSYAQGATTIDVTDDLTDTWPLVINQYYEGAGSDKYIEIKNISAAPVQLSDYRLTSWSNAATENWKTNTGSPNNNNTFPSFSLPAGATYLIKGSGAALPAYAASGANTTMAAAAGFNGNDSVVLYFSATQSIANIVDAIGFTDAGNEGSDKTFYRTSTAAGYNLTSGSDVLDFPTVWAVDKTLANVASAAITDEWYLKPYSPPTPPSLDTFTTAGGSATSVTGRVSLAYTATGGIPLEFRVSESIDFTGASWQPAATGLTFDLSTGLGTKTVYFQLRNNDGTSAVLSDTIDAVAYTYNQSVLITQYYDPDLAGANNKYIELTNVSASPVDLTGWTLIRWGNQEAELYKITGAVVGSPSSTVSLTPIGTLAVGQTVVVANSGAAPLTPAAALNSGTINHNGNDSVAIYSGAYSTETLVDVIGFTNVGNEGVDKSFVRLTNSQGFGFTTGLNVTGFTTVWQEFALAAVDGAGATANEKLGVYPGSTGNTYETWNDNLANQTADQDFDGDGLDNGTEYFMGTAGNAFTQNPAPDASRLLSFPVSATATGVTGIIQSSPDLVTWTTLASTTAGGFITATIPAPDAGGKIFARLNVVVTP